MKTSKRFINMKTSFVPPPRALYSMRFAGRDRDERAKESRTTCEKGDGKTAQRGMLRQNEREIRHDFIAKAELSITCFVFWKPATGAQRSNQGMSRTEAERHTFSGERIQIAGSVADKGNIPAMNRRHRLPVLPL
jgi:hypothetical protein